MDRSGFAFLFETALQRSLEQAGLPSSGSDLLVEFHGRPNPRHTVRLEQIIDLLWISADRFYFIVDVGVIFEGGKAPLIFVRPSGHDPRPFSGTWNPTDLGPFKAIGPGTRGGRS